MYLKPQLSFVGTDENQEYHLLKILQNLVNSTNLQCGNWYAYKIFAMKLNKTPCRTK